MTRILAVSLAALLSGCLAATATRDLGAVSAAAAAVQAACQEALPLADLAMPLPEIGPMIALGVRVGCGSAAGIERLAADPSTVAWLAQQSQMLRDALARRGMLRS